jgi:hypothetical protein
MHNKTKIFICNKQKIIVKLAKKLYLLRTDELENKRRFGGNYCFHFQGNNSNPAIILGFWPISCQPLGP